MCVKPCRKGVCITSWNNTFVFKWAESLNHSSGARKSHSVLEVLSAVGRLRRPDAVETRDVHLPLLSEHLWTSFTQTISIPSVVSCQHVAHCQRVSTLLSLSFSPALSYAPLSYRLSLSPTLLHTWDWRRHRSPWIKMDEFNCVDLKVTEAFFETLLWCSDW